MKLQKSERSYFKDILINHFTLTELYDIAFNLGIDYKIFNTTNLLEFALELINYAERRGQFSCLFEEVEKNRAEIFLQDERLQELAAKISPCEPDTKVQIILHTDVFLDIEKIPMLATILGVKETQLNIIAGAIGSTRWLISLTIKALDFQRVLKNISLKPDNKIIDSLVLYEMLSIKAQYVWRHIAFKSPPKLIEDKLFPSITWNKAKDEVKQLPHLPHSTIENLNKPSSLSSTPQSTEPSPPPPIIQTTQPTSNPSAEQPSEPVRPPHAPLEPPAPAVQEPIINLNPDRPLPDSPIPPQTPKTETAVWFQITNRPETTFLPQFQTGDFLLVQEDFSALDYTLRPEQLVVLMIDEPIEGTIQAKPYTTSPAEQLIIGQLLQAAEIFRNDAKLTLKLSGHQEKITIPLTQIKGVVIGFWRPVM